MCVCVCVFRSFRSSSVCCVFCSVWAPPTRRCWSSTLRSASLSLYVDFTRSQQVTDYSLLTVTVNKQDDQHVFLLSVSLWSQALWLWRRWGGLQSDWWVLISSLLMKKETHVFCCIYTKMLWRDMEEQMIQVQDKTCWKPMYGSPERTVRKRNSVKTGANTQHVFRMLGEIKTPLKENVNAFIPI